MHRTGTKHIVRHICKNLSYSCPSYPSSPVIIIIIIIIIVITISKILIIK